MKRAGIVLALLIILLGAWVDWTYHSIRTEVSEIGVGLPSEEQLNGMQPDQLAGIKANLTASCDRVAALQSEPLAKFFRGAELKTLSDRCELIKARFASVEGP
ncbi:MAG: hypothetical protein ACM3MH_09355 [Actinomycetota bacterium]